MLSTKPQHQFVPWNLWLPKNAAFQLFLSRFPADIEEAVCELVGERYNYKNRIGTVSKSLGGQETVSFSQKDMPDFLRSVLNPYKNVIPV